MARLNRFERSGLSFDVVDGGPEDGELVVLLHGFPDEPACWDAVLPALHAAGHRTLAPELRGYGAGARPRGRAAYRLEEGVRDVLALLVAAGAHRAHVVGHDWGGSIAWALAGRHPERVNTLSVLSTPHPSAFARGLLTGSQAPRSAYMALFQLPWLPERLVPRRLGAVLRDGGLPEPYAQRLVARAAEPGRLGGALGWYRALPFSVLEEFPPSPVPTTFIWGRHDVAISRTAAELTRAQVRAPYRFVELSGGHWLAYTHPVEVGAVLLDRLRAAAPA